MKTEFITAKKKGKVPQGSKWVPTVGDETQDLLDYFHKVKGISQTSCERLKKEAVRILSKCGNPEYKENSDTGLVFGYIQSGKTMSYTTLSTLAKDNNYQIIILIAGITNNLLHQTSSRLSRDLRINIDGNFEWKVLQNPTKNEKHLIQNVLDQNRKFSGMPNKTLLITVLKQAIVLKKLISVLSSLNLEGIPTLIIDDEGDQASLNTAARRNANLDEKGMSTIYSRIIELKEIVPHHTLLQYTATPQAPFFIGLLDRLSPNFIELLDPGEDYVGGKEFFHENSKLIRYIPAAEIYDKDNEFEEPPETLIESMRVFFLCVALGLMSKRKLIKSNHLSMMVHPSHLTAKHDTYHNWIIKIRKRWMKIMEESDDSVNKEVLLSEFENTYNDLKKTNPTLPDFSDIDIKYLDLAIVSTDVHELNSRTGSDISWGNYSNILVGGQVMDRGFTVEGLIVTYMPRGIGGGNVDTIQQRARFFGYKKQYLSFCRIYLGADTKDAYEKYLLHEDSLRDSIREHNKTGKSLNSLKRKVILASTYRPTRPNVISGKFRRYTLGDWFTIKAPHDSKNIMGDNRKVTEAFIKGISWEKDKGHKNRTPIQIHDFSEVLLKKVLEELLQNLSFTRETDTYYFTLLINSLNEHVKSNKLAKCAVYVMSQGKPRERSLSERNEVEQLYQGPNPKGKHLYPGDKGIRIAEQISIQIHRLDLKDKKTNKVIFNDVYSIAVWLPDELGEDYIELIENE